MNRYLRCVATWMLASALCTVAAATAQAAAKRLTPEEVTTFAIPRMAKPPTIDGTLDAAEWREACAVSGLVDQGNDILLPRPTTYYLAWDPDHLYFACRTYLRAGYKPNIRDGRSEGLAYCFDDGLELMFYPMGQNVSAANKRAAFRLFMNCLGYVGDLTRLDVGQQMKNWGPHFKVAVRITEPGTAPDGGSWWELEASSTPEDFELTGPHQVGDQWRFMLGFNHIPMWNQSRIPCVGSYFDPQGKCLGTLVENTPAVQFTMDSLSNLSSDGTASMAVRAYNPAKKETKLTVTVNVADKIVKEEALALPAGGEAAFELADKLPTDVKTGLATLRVAQGETCLLSYAAYFHVGKYNRFMAPVKPRDPSKFSFTTAFNPVRNLLLVKADSYYLPDPDAAKSLAYRVLPDGSDKPVVEGTVNTVAEWYFQDVVDLPPLKPGKYTVEATMNLAGGKTLGPMTRAIEKKDEAEEFPLWWGKKFGDVERVLPPFTAMTRKDNTVTCWGREYKLNALGLPAAVASQGEAVLAAPARIVAVIAAKEQAIDLAATPKITEEHPWRVRFEGQAAGAGLALSAKGWLEQDGLVHVELTYRPAGEEPVRVDSLRIEYPIAEADADCLLCIGPGSNFSSKTTILLPREKQGRLWSTLDTGRTGSGMAVGSFYPTVWIGSERRGLLWWADSDRGWSPDDEIPAHEAVRQGDAVLLRNNIIGKPVELNQARTIAFSYMASPFRPLPKGWRMIAATEDGTFFQPFRAVRKDSKTGEKLWDPARGNINWIHPESRYPEEWTGLWAQQKKSADAYARARQPFDPFAARSGVNFTHMSFQLIGYGRKSIEEDLYKYFGAEWMDGGRDTWNETYIDYAMYLFDRAFREGGVRSTYWDLTFPILYKDLLCGLGYRLPDGRTQRGYNGLNQRRFFMRLHALNHDHGLLPGCTGSHSTHAYVMVALPWLDAVLDGERNWNLDTSDNDWVDYYPLDRIRALSVPHNWGTGICWMSNFDSRDKGNIRPAKITHAEYVWMHDSWRNPYLSPGPTRMPNAILDWGINGDETTYHPYWRNPYVTCADKDVLVSLWRLPDRVMLGVYNYNREKATNVTLKIDLDKLGLVPKLKWQEFIGVRDLYAHEGDAKPKLDFYARTLKIKGLKPHTARFIGVRRY